MIEQRRSRSFSPQVESMEPRKLLNATYTVTNPYNDVQIQGSLRWAIQASNETQSTPQAPNTIQFSPGIAGATITNGSGPIYVTASVNILGGGQVLSGLGVSQMMVTSGSNTTVNVSNLTFDHCRANGNPSLGNWSSGGAILCLGNGVGVYGVMFHDDTASLDGGAIFANSGGVWVGNCTFEQDYAGLYGGAIMCNVGTPLVFNGSGTYFFYDYAGLNGGAIAVQSGYYHIYSGNVWFDHCRAGGDNINPNNVYQY